MGNFYKLLPALLFLSVFTSAIASLKVKETPSEKSATTSVKITKIVIKSDSGDIKISKGAETSIRAKKVKFNDQCRLDLNLNGSTLEISAHKTKSFFNLSSQECHVDFDIIVPLGCSTEIKLGKGNTIITDVKGDLSLKMGKGDLTAQNLHNLKVENGTGTTKAVGITGNTFIQMGSGEIILSYETLIKKPKISLSAGNGNLNITLPSSAVFVPTLLVSPNVTVKNAFPKSEGNSNLDMEIKMGSGSIQINN